MEKVAFKAPEAAKALGVDVKALRQAMKDGQVPSVRIGHRQLVPAWFINQQRLGPNTSRTS